MDIKGAWKISGWYMFALGIIHNLVGVMMTKDALLSMLNDGLVNSVNMDADRNVAFWFLFLGFFFMYVGLVWQGQIKRYREPLSKFSAWGLTALTFVGVAIAPFTGFWLIMPLCFIMLYPHYSKGRNAGDKR